MKTGYAAHSSKTGKSPSHVLKDKTRVLQPNKNWLPYVYLGASSFTCVVFSCVPFPALSLTVLTYGLGTYSHISVVERKIAPQDGDLT